MLESDAEQKLLEFSKRSYPKNAHRIAPNITHMVGYGHSNVVIIEGDTSVILIDALDTDVRAGILRNWIQENVGKPVKTIIFTHGHPDHRGGAGAFRDTVEEVIAFASRRTPLGKTEMIQDILKKRTTFQFGYHLTEEEVLTQGMGIREGFTRGEGQYSFLPITTLYRDEHISRIIDGIQLEMISAVGETDDQIMIWLPKHKVMCVGDNYYACWPNLYALRGGPYRDVSAWIESLNQILTYPAEAVLPGHTNPLLGFETVQRVLTDYRDALNYILEETLKGMNVGKMIDELADEIQLPMRLRNLPYLGEFYGTVAWSVRSVFVGYLGWFDGNPTNLNPLGPKKYAQKMANLIQLHRLIEEINKALKEKEYQWVLILCDILMQSTPVHPQVKQWKAEACLALAKQETSANGRHYYISVANELLTTK